MLLPQAYCTTVSADNAIAPVVDANNELARIEDVFVGVTAAVGSETTPRACSS